MHQVCFIILIYCDARSTKHEIEVQCRPLIIIADNVINRLL
jgi:hypothetical protein